MHKDYEQLFIHLNSPEPPNDLFPKIMQRIHREERGLLTLRRRIAIFSIGLIGSMAAFIPVFKMVQAGFFGSGFINFILLLFSDFEIIATYWQNFAMSLLETLPVMSLIMLLAIIFIFLESLKFLVRDMKLAFNLNK